MYLIGTFFVFRHGKATKLGKLTPEGAEQCARSAATHLAGINVTAIYHGEMPRAEDSAVAMQPHCKTNHVLGYIADRYWANWLKMLRHYAEDSFDRSIGECYEKAPKNATARWWLDNLAGAPAIRDMVRTGMTETMLESIALNQPNIVLVYHDPLISLLVDNLDEIPGTLGNGDCVQIKMMMDDEKQIHFIGSHLPCPPV